MKPPGNGFSIIEGSIANENNTYMKFLRLLYSRYCFLVFILLFLVLSPLFIIFVQRQRWHYYAYKLNNLWARAFYKLVFFPIEIVFEAPLDKNRQYIFCPNHTSFLDIPIMGFTPVYFVFVGKSSISKVPLFGYMYRKLHITVDRDKLRSKYQSFLESVEAVEQGKSLVIFPEGGMRTKNPPEMTSFKEGAFRTAIEKQIPVIPVTIPFNWIILPDDPRFLVTRRKSKLIFHSPISTEGMTLGDVGTLKNTVFQIIDKELKKQNNIKKTEKMPVEK